MPHDRRRFLQQLAAAGTAVVAVRANPLLAATAKTEAFGYSAFSARIGGKLSAMQDGATATLTLTGVSQPKSLKGYPDEARARERCFTLVLRGDAKQPLAEGTYRIEAAGLAPFDAFMSPIRGDGVSYQIVFS